MAAIHIHRTPMREVFRVADGVRWCFRCRKRRPFEYVRQETVELSYYGPTDRIECAVCKMVDGDCFPSTERDWGDS